MNKLSEEIQIIIKDSQDKDFLQIKDFTTYFKERSIAFIIVLLSLPIALPFTPPGINTPFAVVCIILGINLVLNRKNFWLPDFIVDRKIPFKPSGGFFKAMTKMLTWIELIVKPRLGWAVGSKFSMSVIGLGIVASSIVMLIPLPVINSLSSLIVLLGALSIVSKDGLVAIFSTISGILLLIITLFIIGYGIYLGQSFFTNIN